MNPLVKQYFDSIEARMIDSPAIVSYQILRSEITPTEGKLRIKAGTSDKGQVELFIYAVESRGSIQISKYSFHWQDKRENLKKRWDNAPHYSNLPNAPHHIHEKDGEVKEATEIPDIFSILGEIEKEF